MKRVLIQDNFVSLEYISTLKDLLDLDINNNEIGLDFAFCLSEVKDKISSYNLVISHPHLEDDCCLPIVRKALEENIKVVFFV